MKFLALVALIGFVGASQALTQWRFDSDLVASARVGDRNVLIDFHGCGRHDKLELPADSVRHGRFPTLSKAAPIQITEEITLEKGARLGPQPVHVHAAAVAGARAGHGILGLGRPVQSGQSAVESVLAAETEKRVVLQFNTDMTGQLVFGARPAECGAQWTVAPESQHANGEQWAVDVEQLTVGEVTVHRPGALFFALRDSHATVPASLLRQLRTALSVNAQNEIDCDPKNATLSLTIAHGQTLRLPVATFVGQPDAVSGKCALNAVAGAAQSALISLPPTALRAKCLEMDWAAKSVGFSQVN